MDERPDAIEGGNFFLGVLVSIGLLVSGIAVVYLAYWILTSPK
jgi:hypothetical protein